MRALNNEEEERISATYNSFVGALNELRELRKKIEEYLASGTEEELANFESKIAEYQTKAKEKLTEIEKIQPDLDRLVKAVDDQERHKKNLKENVELIQARNRIDDLKKEITSLEESAANVEGHETVYEDIEGLGARKEKIMKATARLEGRRGEILESIRSIKVRLRHDAVRSYQSYFSPCSWRVAKALTGGVQKCRGGLSRSNDQKGDH